MSVILYLKRFNFSNSELKSDFFELCKVYSQIFWTRVERTYNRYILTYMESLNVDMRDLLVGVENWADLCSVHMEVLMEIWRETEIRLIWCQFFNFKNKWSRYFIRNWNWNFLDVFTTDSFASAWTFTHHLMSECFVWNWIIRYKILQKWQ